MFNESKHPRDSDGKFTDGNATQTDKTVAAIQKYSDSPARDMQEQSVGKKKMTPAEKIASVHIDFSKDNILPELNDSELEKVGARESKPILLKKSVI